VGESDSEGVGEILGVFSRLEVILKLLETLAPKF
jgi:hypothetical protein